MLLRSFTRATAVCVCVVTLIGSAGCKEDGGVRVTRFEFEGMQAVEPRQLKSVLATTASSRLPWGEKRYFSREQFEADLKRITAFYQDRGFPDARVSSFDVELSSDQTSVDITIRISEGEPLRVERVELEGFDPLTAPRRQLLETRLPLQPGAPLDRALLQASRETALDWLKERGYPYASVRMSDKPGSGERSRIVVLTARPGTLAHHGPIEISGNSSVDGDVIRRQLTFRPGEVYRHSRLLESQRRLYALEVFEFANVEAMRKEGEEPLDIPTRVTVTEGKHRKVTFGIGYGTEERARVEADWRHVNFFGGARTAGILGRYSSLDRGVKLNVTQPYLFSPRYSLSLSGQYWHNDEPDLFKLDNVGGRATITRQFERAGAAGFRSQPAMTLSLTYANEWEQFEIDPDVLEDFSQRDELIAIGIDPTGGGVGSGQRSALSLDAGRNTTGNILDARRGYVASLHLEQAGKWLQGDYNYYEVTAEGRYYVPVGRAIVATRARIGSIDPIGRDITGDETSAREIGVPFHKRYFLGGATNLRGWGRFDVAPLSGFGLPIGGHSMFNFSTELRVPVWGNLGAVLFLDGGNVWSRPWDINLDDLWYDVGPGLRYNTPIGPIRADIGYQLKRIPGLLVNGEPEPRRFRFHFSIGQAF